MEQKKMGRPVKAPESDNIISEMRLSMALSQLQMAELLGVKRTAIAHWESGRHAVPEYIKRLCVALNRIQELEAKLVECESKTKQKE